MKNCIYFFKKRCLALCNPILILRANGFIYTGEQNLISSQKKNKKKKKKTHICIEVQDDSRTFDFVKARIRLG